MPAPSPADRHEAMIAQQLQKRGIRDRDVLRAIRTVERAAFVPEDLVEFAYDDTPLPIGEGQTISQPYIVAYMAELLELDGTSRVLEVGTGSGYAAAIFAELADAVYTVERHAPLADAARRRLAELGYDTVHVRHGDGSKGWPAHAPYDAIAVAAGGPEIPQPLRDQLAVGGRLVLPVGPSARLQRLVRVRRTDADTFEEEDLGAVRFVPLVGTEAWTEDPEGETDEGAPSVRRASLAERIADAAEPFGAIDDADLDALLDRVGDARVVLLGEATHGTSEFYRFRAHVTKALVERAGFTVVAAEADWPDAARLDAHVRRREPAPGPDRPFTRFPTWMWANEEVAAFIEWLRAYNDGTPAEDAVGFYGLDLYSLHTSIGEVLRYLDDVDPDAAAVARQRYGCLTPYERDPAAYGAAALRGRYKACEEDVVANLRDLLDRRLDFLKGDGERFLDAVQNARVVADAEQYYRAMYYGGATSWNLRDRHMFETLRTLLDYRGADTRAVVWAHNSHLGNASATEMGARGEFNVGQLCRDHFGDDAYLIGFGTHTGTVAAASNWDAPHEVKRVRPSHEGSYERCCHDAGVDRFLLPLRPRRAVRRALMEPRIERAIGVIYRPETELMSHYFQATLPLQFDEYVWFDETEAVTALHREVAAGETAETFPFGV